MLLPKKTTLKLCGLFWLQQVLMNVISLEYYQSTVVLVFNP